MQKHCCRSTFLDWYLLSNGSDHQNCGRDSSVACQSFSWLVGRFYDVPPLPDCPLSVITDGDLAIKQDILVCK